MAGIDRYGDIKENEGATKKKIRIDYLLIKKKDVTPLPPPPHKKQQWLISALYLSILSSIYLPIYIYPGTTCSPPCYTTFLFLSVYLPLSVCMLRTASFCLYLWGYVLLIGMGDGLGAGVWAGAASRLLHVTCYKAHLLIASMPSARTKLLCHARQRLDFYIGKRK